MTQKATKPMRVNRDLRENQRRDKRRGDSLSYGNGRVLEERIV